MIIEDEIFVALDLEDICESEGLTVAATLDALKAVKNFPQAADLALVDVNLVDGPTGPSAAWDLYERFGVRSVFITANPDQIENPPPSAIGVIVKPFDRLTVAEVVKRALANQPIPPLEGFVHFSN